MNSKETHTPLDHETLLRLKTVDRLLRSRADGDGQALQQSHFDPFGNELDMSLASNLIGSDPVLAGTPDINPYKFGGKEWDVHLSAYDFSARMYNPSFGRFTTMDPLCEKYYSVSPYAYCNNNPENLVDPEGLQWYSYIDDNGVVQYLYSEGALSDDKKKQYNDLQYLGFYYHDTNNNKYYSLFGKVLDWTDSERAPSDGQIYEKIDRLLIARATMSDDAKVSMFIPGLPLGENRNLAKGHPLIYEGLTFTTCSVADYSGENRYFGNVYWNTKDRSRPDEDTSLSAITELPTNMPRENRSFANSNTGYWLKASNFRGVKRGFQTLQLLFSRDNAAQFMHSYNSIFRGHPNNH